ncbi:MAG: SUMF1/EgtB/PvdO family nonheme iron enzyme [Planctomycetota bacterium]|nr:SUMF1/EgtB/PvdO family nonheme iron enzyme [Planctomycetota bacterium]
MLLLGVGACSRSAVQPLPEEIARLEFMLLLEPAPFQRTWSLAGRFEVTQEEYGLEVRRTERNLPVAMVSFFEAEAWCQEHQMRLPTQWEWQQLATSGRGGFVVPETARNSLELGLRRRLPVGVFERGKTSLGAYDVLGNVREWCVDPTLEIHYASGGSFATRDASSGVTGQLEMLPEERAEDVGFRYFADADVYLLQVVLPLWPQLTRSEQKQAMQHMVQWRANYRIGLAEELRLEGAPEDFCTALAQP